MVTQNITSEEVKTYVNNLNERGLVQALGQLLMYPESREYLVNCAKETHKAFSFPINVEETKTAILPDCGNKLCKTCYPEEVQK